MQNGIEKLSDRKIHTDIENLNNRILLFKKSGSNEKVSSGKGIQKEVSTRFETKFYMVKRFVFSALFVAKVMK